MQEVRQCLKKHGQRRDLEIAAEMRVPLATLRKRLAELSAAGEVVVCQSRVNNTHAKLLECVTVEGVREHQAAFQAIANANGVLARREPRVTTPASTTPSLT